MFGKYKACDGVIISCLHKTVWNLNISGSIQIFGIQTYIFYKNNYTWIIGISGLKIQNKMKNPTLDSWYKVKMGTLNFDITFPLFKEF